MTYGGESDADWRADSDLLHPSDGLIDPGRIPVIQFNAGAMQAAGSKIKSAGIKVHGAGSSVDRAWQGLGHSYRAPETPELLNGSTLVVRKADAVQTRLNQIGDAVWHFAGEMQGQIAKLNGLRAEAVTFVGWARARGSAAWPDASYQTGGLGHMPGRDYNDLLARKVAGALGNIKETEQRYAGQIATAFDVTFNPPPAGPQRFHSRTEAEDAAGAIPDNWRNIDLGGVKLPWGGSRSDGVDQFVDGIGESALNTVLALPSLVGVGVNGSGHLGWSWNTMKTAWTGLGRMSLATNPGTWLVPGMAAMNWKTMTTAFNGFIGKDAEGNWGARGAGRLVGNVGALFIPGADDLAVGALAEKGAAVAGKGGIGYAALGRAMQSPKFVAHGGWSFLDVRALRAMDDSSLLSRFVNTPGNGWHLPSMPEGQTTRAGERALPHVSGLNKEPERDFDGELHGITAAHAAAADGTHQSTRAALDAHLQDAKHQREQILQKAEADKEGKSLAEQTRIQKDANAQIRRLSDQTSRITAAIGRDSDHQFAAVGNQLHDELDGLRGNAGLDPIPGHHPTVLPDAEQSIKDRFMAAGMEEHTAAASAYKLQDLARHQVPLKDWSADQKALLATYLRSGPRITPHTELSKVVGPDQVEDILAHNKDTVGGFVTQDPFVRDAVRPVDRAAALALSYHFPQSWAEQETLRQKVYWLTHRGHAQPYGLPLHGYGEVVYRTHPDDVGRYVIPVSGDTEAALHGTGQDLRGANLHRHDDPAPYTGMGLTAGGVPEYIATGVRMADGTMYWNAPTKDGGVLRITLATFHDGKWYANPGRADEHLDVGVKGEPAAGRSPLLTETWQRMPEGLREYLHSEYAWDLATSQPQPVPADSQQPQGDGRMPEYAEVPTG